MSIINTDYYKYAVDNEVPLRYLFVDRIPVMDMDDYIPPSNIIADTMENFPAKTITEPGVFNDAYNFVSEYDTRLFAQNEIDIISFVRWIYRKERIDYETHILPLILSLQLDEDYPLPSNDKWDSDWNRGVSQDKLYLERYNEMNEQLSRVKNEPFTRNIETTMLQRVLSYSYRSDYNTLIDLFDGVSLGYNLPMVVYNLPNNGEPLVKIFRGNISMNYANIITYRSQMRTEDNLLCFLYSRENIKDKTSSSRDSYHIGYIRWLHTGEMRITITIDTDDGWTEKEVMRFVSRAFGLRIRPYATSVDTFTRQFIVPNHESFYNVELLADIILTRPEFNKLIYMDDTSSHSLTRSRTVVLMRNIFQLSSLIPTASANIIAETNDGASRIRVIMRDMKTEQTANIFMNVLLRLFSMLNREKELHKFYDSIIRMNYRKYRAAKGVIGTVMDEDFIDDLTSNYADMSKNELIKSVFPYASGYARSCQKGNQPIILSEVDAIKAVKERMKDNKKEFHPGEFLSVKYSRLNRLFYPKSVTEPAAADTGFGSRTSFMMSTVGSMSLIDGEMPVYNDDHTPLPGILQENIYRDVEEYDRNPDMYSSRIVRLDDDDVQVVFTCDKFRFPRIINEAKTVVDTELNEHIARNLACCYMNPRVDKVDPRKFTATHMHIMTSDKVVYSGRRGYLSAELTSLLEKSGIKDTFYRIGTSPHATINSLLYAVAYALGLDESVESIRYRMSIDTRINHAVCAQENMDIGMEVASNTLRDEDVFLDPMRFYRFIEEFFDVNVVVFDAEGNAVPPHTLFYTRRKLDRSRKIILLFSHVGSERDRLQVPQCEVIATDKMKIFDKPALYDELDAYLAYNARVLTFTLNGQLAKGYEIIGRNNMYSVVDYESAGYGKVTAQHIDILGKTRALFMENGVIIAIPPTQPFDLPDKQIPAELPDISLVLEQNIKPTSIVMRENKINGIFSRVNGSDFDVYFMVNPVFVPPQLSGVPVNEHEPLIPVTDQPAFINNLSNLKNFHYRLNHVIRFAYLLSGLTIPQFIKKYVQVIGNKFDYENLPKIPRILQDNTATRIIDRIYDTGKIVVPDLKTVEGIVYSLEQLGAVTKEEYPRVIGNYYVTKSDFRMSERQMFFKGSEEYATWVQSLNQNVSRHIRSYNIYTTLEPSVIMNVYEPFVYQRGIMPDIASSTQPQQDEFYLVQNIPLYGRNDSFRMALRIAATWLEKGYNPGYNIRPQKLDKIELTTDDLSTYIDIRSNMIPSFITYVIKNGRMEEESRHGDGPFVGVLQYNIRNNYHYAAVMPMT